jgi:hypothetical protein
MLLRSDPVTRPTLQTSLTLLWCALAIALGAAAVPWFTRSLRNQPQSVYLWVQQMPGQTEYVAQWQDQGGNREHAPLQAVRTLDRIFAIHIQPEIRGTGEAVSKGGGTSPYLLTLLEARLDDRPLPLAPLVSLNPEWHNVDSGGIATTIARPLRLDGGSNTPLRGSTMVLRFTTGPDQHSVLVRCGAWSRRVLLNHPVAGTIDVPIDGSVVLLRCTLPDGRRTRELRVEGASSGVARIVQWSTPDGVARLLDSGRLAWEPDPRLRTRALLGGVLITLGLIALRLGRLWANSWRDQTLGALATVTLWSAGFAGLLILLCFPGLSLPDTAARATASAMLSLPVPGIAQSHWFPPGMAVLLSPFVRWLGVNDGLGLATFLGAAWMYASMGWLIVLALGPRLGPTWGLRLAPLPWLFPLFANVAVTIMPDPWTCAGLLSALAGVLCMTRARQDPLAGDAGGAGGGIRPVGLAMFMLGCAALFTMRANALTVVPALLIGIVWLVRPWPRATFLVLWMGLMVWVPGRLTHWIPWRRDNTLAASLIWEHVGMLRLTQDPAILARHTPMVLAKEGLTQAQVLERALREHNWLVHDGLIWRDTPFNTALLTEPTSPMRGEFVQFVRDEPGLYLRMKLQVWKTLLGLRHECPLFWVNTWTPEDWVGPHGIRLTMRPLVGTTGPTLITFFNEHRDRLLWMALPYPWIALTLLIFVVACWRKVLTPGLILILLGAGAYFGGFFVITPGFHYRYFMPSQTLLVVACIAMIVAICSRSTERRA